VAPSFLSFISPSASAQRDIRLRHGRHCSGVIPSSPFIQLTVILPQPRRSRVRHCVSRPVLFIHELGTRCSNIRSTMRDSTHTISFRNIAIPQHLTLSTPALTSVPSSLSLFGSNISLYTLTVTSYYPFLQPHRLRHIFLTHEIPLGPTPHFPRSTVYAVARPLPARLSS